jgi:hypothetical protein
MSSGRIAFIHFFDLAAYARPVLLAQGNAVLLHVLNLHDARCAKPNATIVDSKSCHVHSDCFLCEHRMCLISSRMVLCLLIRSLQKDGNEESRPCVYWLI